MDNPRNQTCRAFEAADLADINEQAKLWPEWRRRAAEERFMPRTVHEAVIEAEYTEPLVGQPVAQPGNRLVPVIDADADAETRAIWDAGWAAVDAVHAGHTPVDTQPHEPLNLALVRAVHDSVFTLAHDFTKEGRDAYIEALEDESESVEQLIAEVEWDREYIEHLREFTRCITTDSDT